MKNIFKYIILFISIGFICVSYGKLSDVKVIQSDIKVIGAKNHSPIFKHAIDHANIVVRKKLDYEAYIKLKQKLLDLTQKYGYFDAKFINHQVRIDKANKTARVILILKTGERYKFGKYYFHQKNHKFANKFLDRFVKFSAQHYYYQKAIQDLQDDLSFSQYFADVRVKGSPNHKTKVVPVNINLKAQKPQQYMIGIGYGTQTGIRGLLGMKYRYIGKYGHKFNAQVRISKIYRKYLLSYIIPGANPLTDYLQLSAKQNHIEVKPYTANETVFGIYKIKLVRNVQYSLGLDQHFVSYDTDGDVNVGHDKYLMASLGINYLNKKPAGFWEQGFSWQNKFQGGINLFLTDETFLRLYSVARYSYSLNSDNRIYARATVGALGVDDIAHISPTLRFYTGGIDGVRGYSYLSLGPKDANGYLTGGRYLLTGSINFEHRLFKKLSVLAYYDIGNSFNTINHIDAMRGTGIGFSWRTAVGPIKIYFSRALSLPSDCWRFDFTVGWFI